MSEYLNNKEAHFDNPGNKDTRDKNPKSTEIAPVNNIAPTITIEKVDVMSGDKL